MRQPIRHLSMQPGLVKRDRGIQVMPSVVGHVSLQQQMFTDGPTANLCIQKFGEFVAIDGAPVAGLLPFSAQVLCSNHRPGTTLVLTGPPALGPGAAAAGIEPRPPHDC